MRTFQLYGTGTATGNAVAQVTLPNSGRIKSLIVSLLADSITDGARISVELSKSPVSQIAINGAQDTFYQSGIYGNFVTSGLAQFGQNHQIGLDVPVVAGQIIYLHTLVAGTITYFFNGILWVQ